MARQKKETIQIPTKRCLHCGMELEYKLFYKLNNNSNIYAGNDNYLPVCKDCMKILFEQYRIQYMNQFSILGTESKQLNEYEIEKRKRQIFLRIF